MKEITTVITVQITAIEKLPADMMGVWAEKKDWLAEQVLQEMKENHELDDIRMLERKDFIRDLDEQEEGDG
ncbi:MAG: hypothetical protein IKY91_08305 [Akkermansia sp.]|nr:hypothetical protein [Akkermansia sp.]